ncbi:DnaJ family domain-containing protein [Aspergillus lucknowensis]|uniref:DnaJ homologue subfamily C member 28 conserved domain-containing protein n=1 Tax=Aspergillus lucknowensis TaxID=176173 RepID=A0ABR4LWF0_9EURO
MTGRQPSPLKITKLLARYPATRNPRSRRFSTTLHRRQDAASKSDESNKPPESKTQDEAEEDGAMTRRLSEMTEQAYLEGGRSTHKNLSHAGFSEELKKDLEERVAAAAFKSEHASAHSIANMPESAGQGTRDIAGAPPWTGDESTHDVTLRMLDSSKKPLRTPYKIPQPGPIDTRLSPKPPRHPGLRIADAKERTATYTLSQSHGVSEDEREAMRREMRDRFSPGARPMPATLQGLASLANERIEDAIARGQFDKIKRGKGIGTETDHNANSAFIDTTEYFMNKIIQKQEIVPPWIEKQQELAREVDRFRQRLRVEWRRHAARLIASQGGSLETQMRRAEAYAAAEVRLANREKIGKAFLESEPSNPSSTTETTRETETETKLPHLSTLRDPQYIGNERSYLELSIKTINNLTRSYNLQAPPVAQRPYLNLGRELAACYADVAPTLAGEIKRRATERVRAPSSIGTKATSVLDSLAPAHTARVYEEDQSKGYGFKEFWSDLFSKK